jgi:hypothetical protein
LKLHELRGSEVLGLGTEGEKESEGERGTEGERGGGKREKERQGEKGGERERGGGEREKEGGRGGEERASKAYGCKQTD